MPFLRFRHQQNNKSTRGLTTLPSFHNSEPVTSSFEHIPDLLKSQPSVSKAQNSTSEGTSGLVKTDADNCEGVPADHKASKCGSITEPIIPDPIALDSDTCVLPDKTIDLQPSATSIISGGATSLASKSLQFLGGLKHSIIEALNNAEVDSCNTQSSDADSNSDQYIRPSVSFDENTDNSQSSGTLVLSGSNNSGDTSSFSGETNRSAQPSRTSVYSGVNACDTQPAWKPSQVSVFSGATNHGSQTSKQPFRAYGYSDNEDDGNTDHVQPSRRSVFSGGNNNIAQPSRTSVFSLKTACDAQPRQPSKASLFSGANNNSVQFSKQPSRAYGYSDDDDVNTDNVQPSRTSAISGANNNGTQPCRTSVVGSVDASAQPSKQPSKASVISYADNNSAQPPRTSLFSGVNAYDAQPRHPSKASAISGANDNSTKPSRTSVFSNKNNNGLQSFRTSAFDSVNAQPSRASASSDDEDNGNTENVQSIRLSDAPGISTQTAQSSRASILQSCSMMVNNPSMTYHGSFEAFSFPSPLLTPSQRPDPIPDNSPVGRKAGFLVPSMPVNFDGNGELQRDSQENLFFLANNQSFLRLYENPWTVIYESWPFYVIFFVISIFICLFFEPL